MEGSSANDFGVLPEGANVAFLSRFEANGVSFSLGDDEAALVEAEDELAEFEGVAGDGMHLTVGDAINNARLEHGCNKL